MNKIISKLLSFVALSSGIVIALPASAAADLRAGRMGFDANSCSSCHEVSTSTIGPSLKDIAKRYKSKPVAAELAQRIRAGSGGRWGEVPHPAYEGMDEAEALQIAHWILGGAPR